MKAVVGPIKGKPVADAVKLIEDQVGFSTRLLKDGGVGALRSADRNIIDIGGNAGFKAGHAGESADALSLQASKDRSNYNDAVANKATNTNDTSPSHLFYGPDGASTRLAHILDRHGPNQLPTCSGKSQFATASDGALLSS